MFDLLFLLVGLGVLVGVPVFLFYSVLDHFQQKANSKIKCPHCGAKWWSSNVRGGMGLGNSYWAEYFCYNCQRYWT